MKLHLLFVLISILALSSSVPDKKFPRDFKFAVATASYQVEGAWDEDGKGENNWDRVCHTRPEAIANKDNGDIACDSYHKLEEDVELLKQLGVHRYRFSLSWSRILPTGFINKINQPGVDYYQKLIDLLIQNNIEPMITIFHWDTPQPLEDIGGWPNPLLADYFADYARLAFKLFGDDVKLWLTFNEPKQTCLQGYGEAQKAPLISASGHADYMCTHTLLKAHAKAWHIYDEEFRPTQKGRCGIVLDSDWNEPDSDSEEDQLSAERRLQFTFGWFANPIFNGNYPQVMIDRIGNRSQSEGFPKSRLPEFTPEEIEYIKGTADFLGLNHYTTNMCKDTAEAPIGTVSYNFDARVAIYQKDEWEETASAWLKVVPWGIRNLLNWVTKNFNAPEIIITENGVSDTGTLTDDRRINYYREYLGNVLEAILEDKVNVTGYTAWSFMDNFEWLSGYSEKFGLYQVDFNSPDRTRTPKMSSLYYKQVIATRCLLDECEED